jgi:hypothetical protein
MADKRLGKGLDALIPSYATDDRHIDGAVPLTQIIPNRNQPRQDFNPELHEALMSEESEKGENVILREFEKGYNYNDKILRHAKVVVSKS